MTALEMRILGSRNAIFCSWSTC